MSIDVTGLGSVADFGNTIWTTIFGRKPTPEEQAKFESIANDRDSRRDESKERVMTAELAQGDLFTKRARPTIVYTGLAAIVLNHVIFPQFVYFSNMILTTLTLPVLGTPPSIELPTEFWWAWTGVCSVYAIGRSAEKVKVGGMAGKIAGMITGSR
jgi:hypothetical protein